MTVVGFKKLALALPDSTESSHHGHPDFRVGKRVFATLAYPDPAWAMVKLDASQQAHFVRLHPKIFMPVKGGWGAKGATNVNLKAANRDAVWPALVQAWRNNAPAALLKQHTDLKLI